MTATPCQIIGYLSDIQSEGSVGGIYTWTYTVTLSDKTGGQIASFKINSQTNPFALELGLDYVLELTPITTQTGGVPVCTSAQTSTSMETGTTTVQSPSYSYALSIQTMDGNPSPTFDQFNLTPDAALPLVVGQAYSVNFHLFPNQNK